IFRHALTQQAAYDSILNTARREIHLTVAQTYERLYADRLDALAALLARHYAEAGDDAKTVGYAIRAADRAMQRNAQTEARMYYAQALDALARLPDSVEHICRWIDTLIKQVWVSSFSDAPTLNLARLDQ